MRKEQIPYFNHEQMEEIILLTSVLKNSIRNQGVEDKLSWAQLLNTVVLIKNYEVLNEQLNELTNFVYEINEKLKRN